MRAVLVRITIVLAFVLMWQVAHASSLPEIGDRETVLQTIAMESASEPFEGQVLVARVLVNRALNRGTTLGAEALRRKQFSCWNDRAWSSTWLKRHYTPKVRSAAVMALDKALELTTLSNITHYHTIESNPYWAGSMKLVKNVGGHRFYAQIAPRKAG